MFETTIKWHKATDGMPEKTGYYLTIPYQRCIMTLPYSSVYERFNAFDYDEPINAEQYTIAIQYWAEIPAEMEREALFV